MNEIDYKKLFSEARKFFSLEWDYTKLTAVEKLTVLLSSIAFVAVVMVICIFLLQFLFSALISVLASALGHTWANLIAVALLLVLLLVVFAFKKRLIVDPVARFVSKLFLKPEDNE